MSFLGGYVHGAWPGRLYRGPVYLCLHLDDLSSPDISTHLPSYVPEVGPPILTNRPPPPHFLAPPTSGCFEGTPPDIEENPSKPPSNEHNPPLGTPQAEDNAKSHNQGKKAKCVKARYQNIALRLGKAMDTTDRFFVGQVLGWNYSMTRLKQWTVKIWGHILTDLPFLQTLVRGWFTLHFARVEHTTWILSKFCHIEHTPMLLKIWSPLFDPEREQMGIGPLWVRLLGFPLHFLSEDIFWHIGNALGTYLEHANSYLSATYMSLVRILVHLDTRECLEEKITLHWITCAFRFLIMRVFLSGVVGATRLGIYSINVHWTGQQK